MTPYLLRHAGSLFARALNKRVRVISLTTPPLARWALDTAVPVPATAADLTLGLILDHEHALAPVEKGPPGDASPALLDAFRATWGDRAQLCRFADGAITHSVTFACDGTLEQRALLVARMTAFLLSKHYGIAPDDGVVYWAGLGNRFLKPPGKSNILSLTN